MEVAVSFHTLKQSTLQSEFPVVGSVWILGWVCTIAVWARP